MKRCQRMFRILLFCAISVLLLAGAGGLALKNANPHFISLRGSRGNAIDKANKAFVANNPTATAAPTMAVTPTPIQTPTPSPKPTLAPTPTEVPKINIRIIVGNDEMGDESDGRAIFFETDKGKITCSLDDISDLLKMYDYSRISVELYDNYAERNQYKTVRRFLLQLKNESQEFNFVENREE